jgi:hypothetical protein
VCSYILHDAAKTSSDRVLWTDKLNIFSHADDAWFEMYTVARDQAELKQRSGQDARGRKNAKPVLHYTLAWAASDNPSPEHMREAALSSLKALKLEQHQVLMAAHSDKEHMHVHLVVNTIHPDTGLTAPLKYTKEHLSRWAEGYEKQHGIHCEERIKNNEARDNIRTAKEATRILMAGNGADGLQPQLPYVPVKHAAVQRSNWFDRKEIIDRMKELRTQVAPLFPGPDMAGLWQRQFQEREALDNKTHAAVDHARSAVYDRFRPQWRELYRCQKKEMRHLQGQATHPLERAVFVYEQRERLGDGKPLTMRQMMQLIVKPERLLKRVACLQEKERRALARTEKSEKKLVSERIWDQHKQRFSLLREQQAVTRHAARSEHEAQLRFVVTFDLAKATLQAEREAAKVVEPQAQNTPQIAETFNESVTTRTPTQMARVEAIKQQMEEWRKRNPGRDFGREM